MFLDIKLPGTQPTSDALAATPRDHDRDLPLAGTSSLLALGAELKACVEHPTQVTIGAFAALIERLQGELRMVSGDSLCPALEDDYAGLFRDGQTREFSQYDVNQIEAALTES
jgi:hypothetical protein